MVENKLPDDSIVVQYARQAVAADLKKKKILKQPIAKFDPKTGNVIESCGRYGSSYITIYSTDKKKVYLRKSLPKYVFGTIV